jgi:hypothetical protein
LRDAERFDGGRIAHGRAGDVGLEDGAAIPSQSVGALVQRDHPSVQDHDAIGDFEDAFDALVDDDGAETLVSGAADRREEAVDDLRRQADGQLVGEEDGRV